MVHDVATKIAWGVGLCILLAACHSLPPSPPSVPASATGATTSAATAVVVTPPAPSVHRGPLPLRHLPPAAPPSAPAAPAMIGHFADGQHLPAVQSLLRRAERYRRQGRLDLASHDLEQALRLAPQSSLIFLRLAELRLQQHHPAAAEHLARRGLLYSRSIPERERLKAIIRMHHSSTSSSGRS